MTTQILTQTGRPAREEEEREADRFLFSPWHLVLIPIAVVMLIPMVWMLVTSLETLNETRHFPPVLLPHALVPGNYTQVLQQAPFARWFVNTMIVTVATVAGNLLFCSLAGYAFARIKFFGREVVFVLLLVTLMIPFQVVMIPTFIIVKDLGLINTPNALARFGTISAFSVLIIPRSFTMMKVGIMTTWNGIIRVTRSSTNTTSRPKNLIRANA